MDLAAFKPTTTRDLVGFLPVGEELAFAGGLFAPVDDFDQAKAAVDDTTNNDHFIYPPIKRKQTASFIDKKKGILVPHDRLEWKDVPKTERPALLHRPPPSHLLTLNEAPQNGELRAADGAFLVHALGYVFGFRGDKEKGTFYFLFFRIW